MYKATTRNFVTTTNISIQPDGFSQILIRNIGNCDAVVNDSIPLPASETFSWNNDPGIIINESTVIRFTGTDTDKRILIIKTYFK